MKSKLKSLNLRLTELANYLNISRPTLYKYLDEYENKKYKDIDKNTKKVFDFIKKKSTVSKVAVIDFIINEVNDSTSKELKVLVEVISKDKVLFHRIQEDINHIGVKGVVKKIKLIYKKEIEND